MTRTATRAITRTAAHAVLFAVCAVAVFAAGVTTVHAARPVYGAILAQVTGPVLDPCATHAFLFDPDAPLDTTGFCDLRAH